MYLKKRGSWPLYFWDQTKGKVKAEPEKLGDVVLARRDIQTSYHLAVTLDDHLQNISHVVRGSDLFTGTHIHRTLQALLDLKTPKYIHHKLLISPEQTKLSKSKYSPSIKSYREKGGSLKSILKKVQLAQKIY
ncbi:MAG: glutamate--tRNA ligase family protein [Sphingomonadales bacterium]